MASDREKMESWPLGQVADSMSNAEPTSVAHTRAMAEIIRRQTVLQQEATDAQKRGADATAETARFTQLTARYMLWSVVVLALASVANLLVTLFR